MKAVEYPHNAMRTRSLPQLLREALVEISAVLNTELTLAIEFQLDATDHCCFASTGLSRAKALALGKQMMLWHDQPHSGELLRVYTPGTDGQQQHIRALSPAALKQWGISGGCLIAQRCLNSELVIFAGTASDPGNTNDPDYQQLQALAAILRLAVEQLRLEQEKEFTLWRLIELPVNDGDEQQQRPRLSALLDGAGNITHLSNDVTYLGATLDPRDAVGRSVPDIVCTSDEELIREQVQMHWSRHWQSLQEQGSAASDFVLQSSGRHLQCVIVRCEKPAGSRKIDSNVHAFITIEDVSAANQYVNHTRDSIQSVGQLPLKLAGYCVIRDEQTVFANQQFRQLVGLDPDCAEPVDARSYFEQYDKPAGPALGGTIYEQFWMSDEQLIAVAGKQKHVLGNTITVDCQGSLTTLCKVVEVPQHMDTKLLHKTAGSNLQTLSKKLIEKQEEDRKRIAMELHDSIGQSISATKLSIEIALREYADALPDPGKDYLRGAIRKLSDTMTEVRRISMDLRPSMLDDLGLLATIGWLCREFGSLVPNADINIRIGVDESDIPEHLKLDMFRILQEALNNIGKHAQASRVMVSLQKCADELVLIVEDNGQGFDVKKAAEGRGYGFYSMRQRAKNSHGTIDFSNSENGGTQISAHWNVQQQ